jgi:hypothetical protein
MLTDMYSLSFFVSAHCELDCWDVVDCRTMRTSHSSRKVLETTAMRARALKSTPLSFFPYFSLSSILPQSLPMAFFYKLLAAS